MPQCNPHAITFKRYTLRASEQGPAQLQLLQKSATLLRQKAFKFLNHKADQGF